MAGLCSGNCPGLRGAGAGTGLAAPARFPSEQGRGSGRTCQGTARGSRSHVPLQSHCVVRDAMLIALSGAWCFVKKIFNVDFIEKQK